ncbi:MAG: lipid-A-disaccharide synthase [Thermodesulfobacteriota bacterium]
MDKTVLIISGEESGDSHGGALISELKTLVPSLRVIGMGGEKLRQAGLEGIDSKELSVVGFVEVVKKFPEIRRAFNELKSKLDSEKVDCVILVDYPDFNLRFAKEAKKRGIPVVFYISPQVWAWRAGRVKKIAKLVDKMLVVFPFELPIYEAEGVNVEFVGHPLTDSAVCGMTKLEAKDHFGYDKYESIVTLLPGSRSAEVERMMPLMIEAAEQIKGVTRWKIRFIIPVADSIDDAAIDGCIKDSLLDIKVVRGEMYAALRASDAAVVTSGTATLETALIGTPMLIVYKLSNLSYLIGRALIGVKSVGLPNIIAGRPFVPELLQWKATPLKVCEEVISLLEDSMAIDTATEGYSEIKEKLGEGGASIKAAKAVYEFLGGAAGNS